MNVVAMFQLLLSILLALVLSSLGDGVEVFFTIYTDWKNGGQKFIDFAKSNEDIQKAVE